jgi:ribosomal protein L21E
MAKKKRKNIREKGKIEFSEYFKELKDNQRVSIVKEKSVAKNFSDRFIGISGKIIGSRGNYKIVELKDGGMKKRFVIHPVHLKVLK